MKKIPAQAKMFSDIVGEGVFKYAPKMDVRHPLCNDANGVLFGIDDTVYLAFEDENDGYRSSAAPLLSFVGAAYELGGGYHSYLNEEVVCSYGTSSKYAGKADCLEVRSKETGRLIFRVGTDNTDDYYPSFVCEWSPEHLSANAKART